MKQGSLFCFVTLTNHSASCCTLGIFGKLWMSKGALTWFETVWSYSAKAIDYSIIFSMKNK
jgi:hypothetical protein